MTIQLPEIPVLEEFIVLPSVQYSVWRIKVPHEPELHAILGSEYVLTSHPLSVDGEAVRARIKAAYPWCPVHLVKLDHSVWRDEGQP